MELPIEDIATLPVEETQSEPEREPTKKVKNFRERLDEVFDQN